MSELEGQRDRARGLLAAWTGRGTVVIDPPSPAAVRALRARIRSLDRALTKAHAEEAERDARAEGERRRAGRLEALERQVQLEQSWRGALLAGGNTTPGQP